MLPCFPDLPTDLKQAKDYPSETVRNEKINKRVIILRGTKITKINTIYIVKWGILLWKVLTLCSFLFFSYSEKFHSLGSKIKIISTSESHVIASLDSFNHHTSFRTLSISCNFPHRHVHHEHEKDTNYRIPYYIYT